MDGKLPRDDEGAGGSAPDFKKVGLRETIRHSYVEAAERAETRQRAQDEVDKKAALNGAEKPAGKEPAAGKQPADDKVAPKTDRERDEQGRFAGKSANSEDGVSSVKPVDKQQDATHTPESKPAEATPPQAALQPQPTSAPAAPSSWAKEKHDLFAKADPGLQQYITERERQMQEGVQKLKSGYAELDNAIAPYRQVIAGYNQSPATTIKQMFDWHMALAGPQKEAYFAELGRRFGIDLSRIAPAGAPPLQQQPGSVEGIPPQVQQMLAPLLQRQQALEQQLQREQQAQQARSQAEAAAEVATWSKDKPHFERVRGSMQQLVTLDLQAMQAGREPSLGVVDGMTGKVNLDRCYERAIALDEGLATQIAAERQAKLEAEVRAKIEKEAADKATKEAEKAAKEAEEAEKARAAGSSIKPRTGGTLPRAGQQVPKGESVRDSIRRAVTTVGKR